MNCRSFLGEYDPTFNVEEFRKFFENGMDRTLYRSYRLILEKNLDWDKLKKIVRKLEDISGVDEVGANLENLRLGDKKGCHHCHHIGEEQYRQPPRQPQRRSGTGVTNAGYGVNRPVKNYYQKPNTNFYRGNQYRTPQNDQSFSQRPQTRRFQSGPTPPPRRRYDQHQVRFLPNTRNTDGRPRCFRCNKIGHFAVTCCQNGNEHSNSNGRRNN